MEMTGLTCNKEQDGVHDIEGESMGTENNDSGSFDMLSRTIPVQDGADEDCLNLFKNSFCQSILNTIIGDITNSGYGNKVGRTILTIERLDGWNITNIELFKVKLSSDGGRWNQFTIIYSSNLKLTTE